VSYSQKNYKLLYYIDRELRIKNGALFSQIKCYKLQPFLVALSQGQSFNKDIISAKVSIRNVLMLQSWAEL
jgi:hypothetical protein